jgi:hypothetical protein
LLRIAPTLAGTCLIAAVAAATAVPGLASAAAKPQIKLATKTLAITSPSKLTGSHLKPKVVYDILLAQPNLKHKKFTGLVGGGVTDARGKLSIKVQAPAKAACGTGMLYAFTAKTKTTISLKVKVTGCKAAKSTIPPPPPPAQPTPTSKP